MSEYKTGDRVRVSFEAEIKTIFDDGDLGFELVDHYSTEIPHEGNFSIEKVEPPVVTFQPGDVVRRKEDGLLYLVTLGGWVPIGWGWSVFMDCSPAFPFTSRYYEKVEL